VLFVFESPGEGGNIVVEGYREVLASKNAFFKNMFDFEGDKREIKLTQYDSVPFQAVVSFLQEGKLALNTQHLVSVLDLAQELFVNDLLQLTQLHLLGTIQPDNFKQYFNIANLYAMTRLRQTLVQFGAENWMQLY